MIGAGFDPYFLPCHSFCSLVSGLLGAVFVFCMGLGSAGVFWGAATSM